MADTKNISDLTLSENSVGFCETRDVVAIDMDSDEHPVVITDPQVECACLDSIQALENRLEASGYRKVDHQCWKCLQTYAGSRGLKIHLAKSSCGRVVLSEMESIDSSIDFEIDRQSASGQSGNPAPTVVPEPGVQTRESSVPSDSSESQVNIRRYSVEDEITCLQGLVERVPVKWPAMKEDSRWESLESHVMGQLPVDLPWIGRLVLLQDITYSEGAKLFGFIQTGGGQGRRRSRREVEIAGCREDIRGLVRRMKVAPPEESYGLDQALYERKERRRMLRRAENARKRRKERRRLRKSFYQNPFKAAKEMLSPRVPTKLCVEKEVLDEYVREVASDPDREVELGELSGLPDVSAPVVQLRKNPFTDGYFRNLLKRKRSSSTPGPNKIPYTVYKKCPRLARYLLDILNSALRAKEVPLCWRVSDGIMIPKVDSPSPNDIGDFRQIALLNVEGKLFWALVADRLYNYLVVNNSFISPSVQKGSMRKVAGCWEHTAMVWSALKDARKSKSSLAVLWLDLANAYGSVPHKLILFALRRYQVPEDWIDLIMAYYDGLWGKTSASGVSSDWMRYERGIFAGCTISVILFVAAFNVILEYVDVEEVERYKMSNGNSIELLRGFMDDVSILTKSVPMAELALKRTETAVAWARMKLKPAKSRSLVIVKGRSMDVEPFAVGETVIDGWIHLGGEGIPALQRKPLKTLGRIYDPKLSDGWYKTDLKKKLVDGLKMLDRSKARGAMKLWALHHILLQQVRWDLMVYELPVSFMEQLEQSVSVKIRKWLGVSKNLTNVALYSEQTPCPLPFKSLVCLFKETKVNSHLQLSESAHSEVVQNVIPSYTGRKWKLFDRGEVFHVVFECGAIQRCEERVYQKSLTGPPAQGTMGFEFAGGSCGKRRKILSERQQLVQEVRIRSEEELLAKAVTQAVQGRWTVWKDFQQRVISWRSLVYGDPKLERFCIGATFGTLASPTNLKRWGMAPTDECFLCKGVRCTLQHVLSGCPVALGQGRFRYRHDKVLRVICHHISGFMNQKVVNRGEVRFVRGGLKFLKEGGTPRIQPNSGVLLEATDWVFLSDLDRRLVFPLHVATTGLRPDIVIYSNSTKVVIMIELTCPCEENFQVRNLAKLARYNDLKADCETNGWRAYLYAVEVGARGYTAQSLTICLRALGMKNRPLRSCLEDAGNEALRTSFRLWFLRETPTWGQVGFASRASAV